MLSAITSSTMLLTRLLLVLLALSVAAVSCQDSDPAAAVTQCVEEMALENNDTDLQQCVQQFNSRRQNVTSLAISCGPTCVSVLEQAFTDCNGTEDAVADCDNRFAQSVVRYYLCASKEIGADPVLQGCQQLWLNITFDGFQTREHVETLCSDCAERLAQVYSNCPAADVIYSLDFQLPLPESLQQGCAQDSLGRYCTEVSLSLDLPQRNDLEDAVRDICADTDNGDECSPTCRDGLNSLGCCVHFEENIRENKRFPLELCGIEECPVPFTLGGSGTSPGVPVSLVAMTISLLFASQ